MCECNCVNINASMIQFPGPDGKTYFLEPNPGCRECDAGPGVFLYLLTDEEIEEYELGDVHKTGLTNLPTGFQLVMTKHFAFALEQYYDLEESTYIDARDLMGVVRDASRTTIQEDQKYYDNEGSS